MATTKRSKGGRAAATRATSSARGRSAKSAKATATKATAKPKTATSSKAKAVAKPKPSGSKRMVPRGTKRIVPTGTKRVVPTRAATATKRPAAKPAAKGGAQPAEVTALKAKFQRERNGLERRLTDAVREIGLLRHHELRAMQLERQLAERDATIARLQTQLAEIERRPAEPVYVHEVQQSLALVSSSVQGSDTSPPDLDEFEDDSLPEDADLVADDD